MTICGRWSRVICFETEASTQNTEMRIQNVNEPFHKPTGPLRQDYTLKDQTHMATLHHGSHLESEVSRVEFVFATFNVIIDVMNDYSYWMYFSAIYVQEQQLSFHIALTP